MLTTGSFPHDNFSSVYWIFTKLDHMIPQWKGKNPIYFGIIRSKVKVTYYKYNFWNQGRFCTITLVLYIGSLTYMATWFPCGRGRTLFILGSLGQRSRSPLLWIEFLTTGSFPHDNFSSVYWIFTKLGHMIPQWKGKNPIYFGVITIIPFDNLYRRTYFVMHTFFVWLENGYRDWNFSK